MIKGEHWLTRDLAIENKELRTRVEEQAEELKKYQSDPSSYVEAVKCLCGSVDDFIKYHHNPIVKQKNEEILKLEADVKQYKWLDSYGSKEKIAELQNRLSTLEKKITEEEIGEHYKKYYGVTGVGWMSDEYIKSLVKFINGGGR